MHYKLNLIYCAEKITFSAYQHAYSLHTLPREQSALFVIRLVGDNITCWSDFLHVKSYDHAGIRMVVPRETTKKSVAQYHQKTCSRVMSDFLISKVFLHMPARACHKWSPAPEVAAMLHALATVS